MKPVIIIPFDGKDDIYSIIRDVANILKDEALVPGIAYFKFNDAIHLDHPVDADLIKTVKGQIKNHKVPHIGIFLDLKMADVSATNLNVLKHYKDYPPDIITISSCCSVESIIQIQAMFPTTKLAMVSALTDIKAEECQARFGMSPAVKIYNDLMNIRSIYRKKVDDEPFDLIVCSAYELEFLKKNLPERYGFIVPGIRDDWMAKDHQERIIGVREALDMGADLVVMGAQIMKGNPVNGVSVEESRRRTLMEINASYLAGDPIEVLKKCNGFYESSRNEGGNYLGPVVKYADMYLSEDGLKNYVGFKYFNFAKADRKAKLRDYFARLIASNTKERLARLDLLGDVLLGAPMGGLQLVGELSRLTGLDSIFTEKAANDVVISRYDIIAGERVIIVEDVCNNFSTTGKMKAEIERHGGTLVAIVCAINRSELTEWEGIPVIAACHIPTKEYKQEDPEVAEHIKNGNFVQRPKSEWDRLKEAMAT